MDRKFLEFWGNFLLNAARGQEQAENLNRLVRDGFKTFEQQLSLFQKLYGLDKKPDPSTPYAEMWATAATDFTKSYQEFLGFMGMVSREDYEALSREHETLKKKFAALEDKHRRSKAKSVASEIDPAEVVKGFEGLIKKQAEQFQDLMASYSKLYDTEKSGKESAENRPCQEPSEKG
ncbi:MAG TPA: hypothetical protein VMB77_14395 [Syntrophales bacterium]|nr:hypothetical protein [Syntrophales bacterium]